ncbi:hypothetical protein [Naasia lichenicola]|uniref:Uncharacterized protein n=1 Tax=Naasia lichenicola TaxID=2565933 RepID=A0A4S4FN81_9MICO|nr:hypothetical protein [Naasia lichenicola]THG30696.1 hypothetical protein E6C64_08630 [Naasia lichenicola]THG31933.1 hypothetical protein E6C64_07775 [Naasia lichenicola]
MSKKASDATFRDENQGFELFAFLAIPVISVLCVTTPVAGGVKGRLCGSSLLRHWTYNALDRQTLVTKSRRAHSGRDLQSTVAVIAQKKRLAVLRYLDRSMLFSRHTRAPPGAAWGFCHYNFYYFRFCWLAVPENAINVDAIYSSAHMPPFVYN